MLWLPFLYSWLTHLSESLGPPPPVLSPRLQTGDGLLYFFLNTLLPRASSLFSSTPDPSSTYGLVPLPLVGLLTVQSDSNIFVFSCFGSLLMGRTTHLDPHSSSLISFAGLFHRSRFTPASPAFHPPAFPPPPTPTFSTPSIPGSLSTV